MKPILPLCLTLAVALTGCAGQAAAPTPVPPSPPARLAAEALSAQAPQSQAPDAPAGIPLTVRSASLPVSGLDLDTLPPQLIQDGAELGGLMESGDGIALVGDFPELDAALYYDWSGGYDQEHILLRWGERWGAYPLNWCAERGNFPQLYRGDFDHDGDEELALLVYTAAGTGVSAWTLCVIEDADGLPVRILSDLSIESDLAPYLDCTFQKGPQLATITLGDLRAEVDLSDYQLTEDSPLEAYTGTIVDYAVDGDSITAQLAVGLYGRGLPYTVCYFCDLQGTVVFDGQDFFLQPTELLLYPEFS